MADDIGQIVDRLTTTLSELRARRDAEVEAVHRKYQDQIDQVQQALMPYLKTRGNGNGDGTDADRSAMTTLYVGRDKLNLVRRDLRTHPRSRQTDIVQRTGLNSGAVSVALRVLRAEGVVKPLRVKERGSRVWECVNSRDRKPVSESVA